MLSAPEPLSTYHDVASFSCGKPALNEWLKRRALYNQENDFTVVMVVHEAGRVVGYYGVAPTAVNRMSTPRAIRAAQTPDPVPCLLLGQFAVDREWAGKGIGSGLFKHAMKRCVDAARLVGGRAVVVNAIDSDAAGYWRKLDFIPSKDDPLVLFRSIRKIASSLEKGAR